MGRRSARAAYRRLGILRRAVHALRQQLKPRDAAGARPDLRELSAQERQRLHAVAHGQSRRGHFPPRLEREFLRHVRGRSRNARMVLACIPLILFGSCPFWMPLLLGLPTSVIGLMETVAIGVIVPLFFAVCLAQARYPTRPFTEDLLVVASLLQVFCLEAVRYQSELAGHRLDPALSVTIPVAVIALGRLPLGRCLILIAGYFTILIARDLSFETASGPRPITTWMLNGVLLAVTLLSAVWTRLAARRQWASNLLLAMIAYKDALTGLPNRRALEEHFTMVSRGLRRSETKMVFLALIDLDHFKSLNDSYGHEFGDGVLSEIGVVLAEFARRPLDMAARIGGEEFALLLYDCPLEAGRARLEELVDAVRGLGIEYGEQQEKRVTCSAGAVAGLPGTSISTLLRIADEHLYKAKREGRDRISVEESPLGPRLAAVK